MKRTFAILTAWLVLFAAPLLAQNHTTSITVSSLLGPSSTAGGTATPVASATLCAVAVDPTYGSAVSFSETGWGFVRAGTSFCGTVTNGSISGGVNVPDACHSNSSKPLVYNITIQTLVAGVQTGAPTTIPGVQNVCDATYPLDSWGTNVSSALPTGVFEVSTGVPSTCADPFLYKDSSTGNLYGCQAGVPALIGAVGNYTIGTTSGTVAAGDDPRIVNAMQAPVAYSSGSTYGLGSLVLWNGTYYRSLVINNIGNQPDQSFTSWSKIGLVSPSPSPFTGQMATTGWTGYHCFGDSYTHGNGASTTANAYCPRLSVDTGTSGTLTNHGIPSGQVSDVAETEVFPNMNPTATWTTLQTLLIGINDSASYSGYGWTYTTVYKLIHRAVISWLTTPAETKYTGASFSSVPTGWSLDTHYAAVTGLQSTTNGSTAVWTVSPTVGGSPIFIWYPIVNGNLGTVHITDDCYDAPIDIRNYTLTPIQGLAVTRAVGVAVLLNTGRNTGACHITTTVSSPTGSGYVAGVLAVGIPPAVPFGATVPKLWVGGVPQIKDDKARSIETRFYNTVASVDAKWARGLGLDVKWVDIRAAFPHTTLAGDDTGDTLHPSDLGHWEIEQLGFLGPTYEVSEPYDTHNYGTVAFIPGTDLGTSPPQVPECSLIGSSCTAEAGSIYYQVGTSPSNDGNVLSVQFDEAWSQPPICSVWQIGAASTLGVRVGYGSTTTTGFSITVNGPQTANQQVFIDYSCRAATRPTY